MLQQEGNAAAGLKQAVQQLHQELQSSQKMAQQSEQQLLEQVQKLQQSSSEKDSSLVQLQRQCQSAEMQLQVFNVLQYCHLALHALSAQILHMMLALDCSSIASRCSFNMTIQPK